MVRSRFNSGWAVQPNVSIFNQLGGPPSDEAPVTLPHDAMLHFTRSKDAPSGHSSGYFPGGSVAYTKTFPVPEGWRQHRVTVEFEGVYRDAMVYVNGNYAGQRPSGYTLFRIPLDPYLKYGEPNTIRVEARAHLDSRWYSGLGIHRDAALIVSPLTHIADGGVMIATPDVEDDLAVVEMATKVANEGLATRTLRLSTEVIDAQGSPVALDAVPVTLRAGETSVIRQRLYLRSPQRWSVERPYLYTAVSELIGDDATLDSASTAFGVRTLQIDPFHGLRVNGETVKLRGACIHHDNGLLGAAAIARAEERRIEILKDAGFNAIRSAHNPISNAMLDACDRLGMLVMDEAFDMWAEGKSSFDYSLAFPEWWERDLESMVAKDFNHPSVIMYSIGNEILDTGKPLGAALGRRLAEKVRSLDESRFVTNGISGFVSTVSDTIDTFHEQVAHLKSGGVNDLMSEMNQLVDQISLSEAVTSKTEESHAVVDVVGHNYAEARYLEDRQRYPNRVVVGTETLATRIDVIWKLVAENAHVIGDFTWTGWDYLGEAALGTPVYSEPDEDQVGAAIFPALLAGCGDIDITGHRRPASFYREIVFGLRTEPYIAVRRPHGYGKRVDAPAWAWSDSIGSWSWDIEPGTPIEVEVYSDADEVELILNGTPLRSAPSGPEHGFRAVFEVKYQRGELVAVARTGGEEKARTALCSADGPLRLKAVADRTRLRADDSDLAFVSMELVDGNGTLATAQERTVCVDISGAGILQAFGSARPSTEERYDESSHTTFDGRALAIVRPVGAGEITFTASAEGVEPVTLRLSAEAGQSPNHSESGIERPDRSPLPPRTQFGAVAGN